MSIRPTDYQSDDAELAAEVARLSELLEQAVVDSRAIAHKATSVADRHALELGKERERTEAALLDIRELQHRIKNTLAIVQSMAHVTLRPDVTYEDARHLFAARLGALARVQDMLFESNWTDTTLTSLIRGIVAPHTGDQAERIRIQGPDVDIGAKLAMVLALALNELATNAVKYGALSNSSGHIEITWTLDAELRLRWHERNGPPVMQPPLRKGFGSRIVTDSVRAQFDGTVELDFKTDGLLCLICVPEIRLKSASP